MLSTTIEKQSARRKTEFERAPRTSALKICNALEKLFWYIRH